MPIDACEIRPAFEFDNRQAAAYLGITPQALEMWRSTGRYRIPFVKIGKRVRYRKADLDAWLESRTVGMPCATSNASTLVSAA